MCPKFFYQEMIYDPQNCCDQFEMSVSPKKLAKLNKNLQLQPTQQQAKINDIHDQIE